MKNHSHKTILFFLLSACSSPNNTRSIYLWKADLKLSEKDTTFFNNADITKLYIRFFDITKNAEKRIIPKGSLKYKGVNLKNYKIIPVIFIENSSLKNTDNKAVKELSENIIEKVKRFYDKKFPENIFTELQLDCDWTASTKESFFKLIDEIKSENNVSITSWGFHLVSLFESAQKQLDKLISKINAELAKKDFQETF